MKTFFVYVSVLFAMFTVCTACSKDDDEAFSPEQTQWMNENRAYLRQKIAETDSVGKPLYKQVIIYGDTALYRITKKEGNYVSHPTLTSNVTFTDFSGVLMNKTVFQKPFTATYQPKRLIPGVAYVVLEACPDETIEAIIPASLGYGFQNHSNIPAGSTLIFTFTVSNIM
ncbi:MAG: FKBP-type peptidyl-prolyl cis-trans isomerase [Tannerellaceae bacterium]